MCICVFLCAASIGIINDDDDNDYYSLLVQVTALYFCYGHVDRY